MLCVRSERIVGIFFEALDITWRWSFDWDFERHDWREEQKVQRIERDLKRYDTIPRERESILTTLNLRLIDSYSRDDY